MGAQVSRPRIATVTPNPALDVTYEIPRLVPGGELRVQAVRERAGGKGFNTAGVLACLGEPVLVCGVLGGATGEQMRAALAERGFVDRCVSIVGATRRTVAVVDREAGETTMLNEPGPKVSADEWNALLAAVRVVADDVSVLTASGSLPRGVDPAGYADVVRVAKAGGAWVLADTSGPALLEVCAARPDVVKPNSSELAAAVPGEHDPVAAARALLHRGAGAVALSRGADGLMLVTPAGVTAARLPERVHGNTAGAGDAVVAALARAFADRGADLLDDPAAARVACADAVAVSAAAVRAPVAGKVDPADVAEFAAAVQIVEP